MTRKKIIIIISIVAAALAAGAIWLLTRQESFFQAKKNQAEQEKQEQNINQPVANFPVSVDSNQATVKKDLNSEEQGITLASRNFAERFGSYSSDSGNINLHELKGLATPALYAKLLSKGNFLNAESGYYGVSSKALRLEILKSDALSASVLAGLQRSEIKGQSQPFVFTQNLLLELTKQSGKWQVASADWQ